MIEIWNIKVVQILWLENLSLWPAQDSIPLSFGTLRKSYNLTYSESFDP